MAITKNDPRTIWLGGPMIVFVNDIAAGASFLPGTLIERKAGLYQKHSVAGGGGTTFALDQPEMNKDYNYPYAAGDLVVAGIGKPGSTFLAWLASGENVVDGDNLASKGDGKLKKTTTATEAIGKALENKNAAAGDARVRMECS